MFVSGLGIVRSHEPSDFVKTLYSALERPGRFRNDGKYFSIEQEEQDFRNLMTTILSSCKPSLLATVYLCKYSIKWALAD